LHIASALARQRATSTCVGRWISPVLPSHASCVVCRPRLRKSGSCRLGISRFRSVGVVGALDASVLLRSRVCRLPSMLMCPIVPLPPELFALVQLPVLRWLSCSRLFAALPPRHPLSSLELPSLARRHFLQFWRVVCSCWLLASHDSPSLGSAERIAASRSTAVRLLTCCGASQFLAVSCKRALKVAWHFFFHLTQLLAKPLGLVRICAPLAVST